MVDVEMRGSELLLLAFLRVSSTRATSMSWSPASRLMRRTPCVLRPISEMPFTGVRITMPPRVMSITSSSSTTSSAATTLPFRSVVWIEMIPFPPRPVTRYSLIGVRLP